MINLKIFQFRNWINDFITKDITIYQIIYNFIIKRLYKFDIIIKIFFKSKTKLLVDIN